MLTIVSELLYKFFMKTKQQKAQQIEDGGNLLKQSKGLIFIDFTGASMEDLTKLRRIIKDMGAKLQVVKKKLLRIIFEKEKIDFNPEQFEAQMGVIFCDKDIEELAAPVYKFAKGLEKKGFKILGAYNLSAKNFIEAETMVRIGKLPAREILLSQLVGVLSAPIRMLMYVLNEKSKQTVEK